MVVVVETTSLTPPNTHTDYYCIVLGVGFHSHSVCSCLSGLRVEDDANCNVHLHLVLRRHNIYKIGYYNH